MDAAMVAKTSATPPMTSGFCMTLPKALPVSAAPMPSAEYMMAMPSTYSAESAMAWRREVAWRAPKIETVMGMSG
jgi:hypothetical protein